MLVYMLIRAEALWRLDNGSAESIDARKFLKGESDVDALDALYRR